MSSKKRQIEEQDSPDSKKGKPENGSCDKEESDKEKEEPNNEKEDPSTPPVTPASDDKSVHNNIDQEVQDNKDTESSKSELEKTEIDICKLDKNEKNGKGEEKSSRRSKNKTEKLIEKLEGSTIYGELLVSGVTNWDLAGRKSVPVGSKDGGGPNLWSPHRVAKMAGKLIRSIISGCTACHSIIITKEGAAYSWGRNDKGQLGHGDQKRRDEPTLIEALEGVNVVNAACGKNHTLLLTDNGDVYSVGDNKMGQLGLGGQTNFVPSPTMIQHSGSPIRKVACGSEFSMIVDTKGRLYSFGCPEYSQTGHNSDGKYFVANNKMAFSCETRPRKVQLFIEKGRDGVVSPISDVEVTDVACGTNHSVCIDSKNRLYTWGFGGYGRLGHSEQKDESVPRMIKLFENLKRGAVKIACGSGFTMAVNESNMLYLWGQTKPSGDPIMYPKPVQDLSGWTTRSMAGGQRSIVVAADNTLITWGASPTCGELCYGVGKAKSSANPQEVSSIGDVYIETVSCGQCHTLLLAKVDTPEDRAAVDALPLFNPKE